MCLRNRVLKLVLEGPVLGALGQPGKGPGQLSESHHLALGKAGELKPAFLTRSLNVLQEDLLYSALYRTCWDFLRLYAALGAPWLVLFPSARTCSLDRRNRYALRSRARAEGKITAPGSRPLVRNASYVAEVVGWRVQKFLLK